YWRRTSWENSCVHRVLILCEGYAERQFVENLLAPTYSAAHVYLIPTIVTTKHIPGFPPKKGGGRDFNNYDRDVCKLLGDSNASIITSMIDLYGLPDNWPGLVERPKDLKGKELAEYFCSKWRQLHLRDPRF